MIFTKDRIESICYDTIADIWRDATNSFPDFFVPISKEAQQANEHFLSSYMKHLKRLLKIQNKPYTIKPLWKKRWNKLIHEILFDEPILGIAKTFTNQTLNEMQREFYCFFKKAKKFDDTISMEEIGQAARNYLVYDIFTQIHSLPPTVTPAIFGYSMLYPYTDNYIDNPNFTQAEKNNYNKMIERRIIGETTDSAKTHYKKTYELIDNVIEFYQKEEKEDIRNGLLYMLEAQKISLLQTKSIQKSPLSKKEIFHISSYKGGISVLLDRFYVPSKITEPDYHFYLSYGFFLQLADDLQDITEDRKLGRQTLFSILDTQKEMEETLNKLFHFLQTILSVYPMNNKNLKDFILKNCYYLLIYSTYGSRENFSNEYITKFEPYLPVSFSFLENIKAEITQIFQYVSLLDVNTIFEA